MTSEVVVMNRMAVALAADSAVTVRVGDATKVRESAVKLFMMSKRHPVGVMVYNNDSLLGIPWETIFKMFRRHLGDRGFESLGEYGEALIGYLDSNTSLFPPDIQDRFFLQALGRLFGEIEARARRELMERRLYMMGDEERTGELDDAEYAHQAIRDALDYWRTKPAADYVDEATAREVVGRNSGQISELTREVFAGWRVHGRPAQQLYELAQHFIAKDHFSNEVVSGVVIAGFGEAEHFPVVQHFEIGGVYCNKVKARRHPLERVSQDRPSFVRAFAYREMVESFLDGVSPRVLRQLNDAEAWIREMPVVALDAVTGLEGRDKETAVELVREASGRKAQEFARGVLGRVQRRRMDIASAVDALTMKELARVASTLVSLSSFQQQMSLDRETVGGPVDVAVISKGDGFIWIERKHYFRSELNRHFFSNYDDTLAENTDKEGRGVARRAEQAAES